MTDSSLLFISCNEQCVTIGRKKEKEKKRYVQTVLT